MMTQIIQWNVRGLLRNLDDVKEILSEFRPNVLCMQETHLNTQNKNFLKQFLVFRKDREGAQASSGGVAIVVQKSVACQHIRLETHLEAVAVRAILFGKLVTVCSLYVPPDYCLDSVEFEKLINEIPEPYLLVGDMNAHNTLWGDSRCDARGRLIENFLMSSGACLLNKKEATY